MEEKIDNNIQVQDEIDLIEIIQKILKNWKLFLKFCVVGVVIGLIVAFSLPKEYVTTVQLAPEISDVSAKNNLGGLAAMAGINLNSVTSGDAFSLDIYPDIIKSTPFLIELFSVWVRDKSGEINMPFFDYMSENKKDIWLVSVFSAPFRLLRDLRDKEIEYNIEDPNIYTLSKEQEDVLKELQERISLNVDKKTSVITISVKIQDPFISAQLTQVILTKLQEYIITYRTQKAKQDLDFTEKVYVEAQEKYFEAQRKYASFKDANRHISTAIYATEEERLKNEMSLTYNVYNSLAQKLEQDRLRVQEQTPVFAIIEPAKVPLKPSSPQKLYILVCFTFSGALLATGYILFKKSIQKIYTEIKAG